MKKGCYIGCGAVLLVAAIIVGLFFFLVFGGNAKVTEDISYNAYRLNSANHNIL